MKNAIYLFISTITLALTTISCSKDDDKAPTNELKIGAQKIELLSSALYCGGTYDPTSGLPEYEGNLINILMGGEGVTLGQEITGTGSFIGIYIFSENQTSLETGTYPYVLAEPYEVGKNWGFGYNLNYPEGEPLYDGGSGTVIIKKISDSEYYIKINDFLDQNQQEVTLEYQGIFPSYLSN